MPAIDISRYQGTVDFSAVKASGVSLVIAKMGGGDSGQYVDSKWAQNLAGIRAAGIRLGSYYFNGPATSPAAAADFQFAHIDWRPGDLVVLDIEGAGIAWSPAQALEWVNRMLTHGVPARNVGIYMSASPERSQNWSAVAAAGVFLWVASYGANTGQPSTPPTPKHWQSWALWQYTSNGSVPGIAGRVDMSQIAPSWAGTNITALDNNVRKPPMSDTRLILAHHLTPAPFFYRAQLGTGALTASQYTQEQANLAAQAIGAQTFEVSSDAELKALQQVLASIPATPATSGSSAASTVDLTPVLQAIAAGEAQDTADLKQLLAAIGQLPADTLAVFGLKRA